MRYRVEVDQSIKIEDKDATVLAFANGMAFAKDRECRRITVAELTQM